MVYEQDIFTAVLVGLQLVPEHAQTRPMHTLEQQTLLECSSVITVSLRYDDMMPIACVIYCVLEIVIDKFVHCDTNIPYHINHHVIALSCSNSRLRYNHDATKKQAY